MTTPSEQQPREAGFFRAIREWGLTRGDNGFLGGVVDGLAQRIGMATVPARIIVVIAALILNGLVVLAYAAAWALLPDRRGNIIIQNFGRGMPNVGALIGIVILTLIGMSDVSDPGPFSHGSFPFWDATPWHVVSIIVGVLVPLVFVGGIVWFVIAMARRSPNQPTGQHAAMPPTATPTTPGAATPRPENAAATAAAPDTTPADAPAPASPTAYAATPFPATTAAAPPAQPAYYPPAPAAPPALPRVPGPGRGFYLTALAWIVLSGAAVGMANRQADLAVHPVAAWFVVMVTGLGVILMAVSLTGRKLGFLGFATIVLALPLALIVVGADDLRDAYANDGSLVHIDVRDMGPQPTPYDATLAFADRYTEVAINGDCREGVDVPVNPASTTRLSFTSLEQDTSIDVATQVAYVTIPTGMDLRVVGDGDAQAHVIWPERNITCDFWNAGGEHLALTNNEGPGVTLVVHDDAYANTIVITEEMS